MLGNIRARASGRSNRDAAHEDAIGTLQETNDVGTDANGLLEKSGQGMVHWRDEHVPCLGDQRGFWEATHQHNHLNVVWRTLPGHVTRTCAGHEITAESHAATARSGLVVGRHHASEAPASHHATTVANGRRAADHAAAAAVWGSNRGRPASTSIPHRLLVVDGLLLLLLGRLLVHWASRADLSLSRGVISLTRRCTSPKWHLLVWVSVHQMLLRLLSVHLRM